MYISGNVTVMVRDFEGAVRFYTDALGMDLRMRAGMDWAEVGVPGLTIGLHHASYDLGPAGGHGSIGLQVDDIDATVALLRSRGVQPSDIEDNGFLKIAHFHDPEGNPLYVTQLAGQH